MDKPQLDKPELNEQQRRLRHKNLALFGVLAGLAVLFFVLTLVRFGGGS